MGMMKELAKALAAEVKALTDENDRLLAEVERLTGLLEAAGFDRTALQDTEKVRAELEEARAAREFELKWS